jgi:hypothetical protein
MIHASSHVKNTQKSIDTERETSTVICFDIFTFKLSEPLDPVLIKIDDSILR